ncbi:uncharacterized protein K489DRAFT_75821 [Dissoconium aciculare CBS 342.82]|uniref:Transmembrane protein n=1 Tax=Dissoconium aciculare CBS 342.82 TaxID=1314786 RepID=A0A6J3LTQ0_9PEZI|nr:uncharacterized protein K489DRAFT_75821 [Dissoconium aciculare CBS 342.82]KAF1819166.1 hypothetical protein K489DRAFT_75821 [Dissoconium aciculare CBS 342.82]
MMSTEAKMTRRARFSFFHLFSEESPRRVKCFVQGFSYFLILLLAISVWRCRWINQISNQFFSTLFYLSPARYFEQYKSREASRRRCRGFCTFSEHPSLPLLRSTATKIHGYGFAFLCIFLTWRRRRRRGGEEQMNFYIFNI